MDLLELAPGSIESFKFHSWLIVEVKSDAGLVGIGEAALSPRVTKQVIDLYLKPILVGENPYDLEFLWEHMYRRTMPSGRKGIGMVAISAVDIAIWDLVGKALKQPPGGNVPGG
jgi:L-alanine-DL-glutamate epimerase-like enolase superfamily enzyme